jgi:hypothetical protein
MEDAMLPPAYYLDESDPDIITLRRKDDTFVAAFSAQGATREGIVEAAMQDSRNPEAPEPPTAMIRRRSSLLQPGHVLLC